MMRRAFTEITRASKPLTVIFYVIHYVIRPRTNQREALYSSATIYLSLFYIACYIVKYRALRRGEQTIRRTVSIPIANYCKRARRVKARKNERWRARLIYVSQCERFSACYSRQVIVVKEREKEKGRIAMHRVSEYIRDNPRECRIIPGQLVSSVASRHLLPPILRLRSNAIAFERG